MCPLILIAAVTEVDYGPFAPLVGYVVTLGSTVGILALTWRGRLKKWKPPEEILPSTSQKLIVLLSMVAIGKTYYNSRPDSAHQLFDFGVYFGLTAFFSFTLYSFIIFTIRYPDTRIHNKTTGQDEIHDILGGFWLTQKAKKTMQEGLLTPDGKVIPPPPTIKQLLLGVDGNIDYVWSRFSRGFAICVVNLLFILTLFFGNLAIGCTGFGIQVHITKKSAEKTVNKEDAPGLNRTK